MGVHDYLYVCVHVCICLLISIKLAKILPCN